MRNKSGVVPTAVIGIIVVVLSLAVFFLLEIERINVNVWALSFLLISELAFFGGLIGLRFTNVNHSKVFHNAGVTTTLSLYFLATLISVIFAGAFRDNLNTFILIELAIIALFAIITIAIFASSRTIERRSEEDMKKVGTTEAKRGGF